MPDKFFLSASGADPVGTVQGLLQGTAPVPERVLWSGRCAVAEYAFDQPASLPRWTLPEQTEVVVTENRVAYVDVAGRTGGELHWPWPQHLRVQPGNRNVGRSATVTQIQLVCAGPGGAFPALVFAGGDLATVADADRLANVLRQAIARFRVENTAELGLTLPQSRMLSRLVIGPEFSNYQGGEGQTVSLLLGAVPVDLPPTDEPFADFAPASYAPEAYAPEQDYPPEGYASPDSYWAAAPVPAADPYPTPTVGSFPTAAANPYAAPPARSFPTAAANPYAAPPARSFPTAAAADPYASPSTSAADPYAGAVDPFANAADPSSSAADPYANGADSYATTADPYATTADPFTSAAGPFASAADPYATTADPFTSAADPFASAADPFASAADPFTSAAGPYATAADPYVGAADPYASSAGPFAGSGDDPYAPAAAVRYPAAGQPHNTDLTRPESVQPELARHDLAARAADLAARVASLVSDGGGLGGALARYETETTNLSAFLDPTDPYASATEYRYNDEVQGVHGFDAGASADGVDRAEAIRRTAARFTGNSARARGSVPRRSSDDDQNAPTRATTSPEPPQF